MVKATGVKNLEEYNKILGSRIKNLRVKNNLTQEEISKRIGCSKFYVSQLERGIVKMPVYMLEEYCKVLGENPNNILEINQDEYKIPSELKAKIQSVKEELSELLAEGG